MFEQFAFASLNSKSRLSEVFREYDKLDLVEISCPTSSLLMKERRVPVR